MTRQCHAFVTVHAGLDAFSHLLSAYLEHAGGCHIRQLSRHPSTGGVHPSRVMHDVTDVARPCTSGVAAPRRGRRCQRAQRAGATGADLKTRVHLCTQPYLGVILGSVHCTPTKFSRYRAAVPCTGACTCTVARTANPNKSHDKLEKAEKWQN